MINEFGSGERRRFIAEPTQTTPFVRIDRARGSFEVKGNSTGSHCSYFYSEVLRIMDTHLMDLSFLKVSFHLISVNPSSLRGIYKILTSLKRARLRGARVRLHWCYENWDLEMKQAGHDYGTILGLHMNFVPV